MDAFVAMRHFLPREFPATIPLQMVMLFPESAKELMSISTKLIIFAFNRMVVRIGR